MSGDHSEEKVADDVLSGGEETEPFDPMNVVRGNLLYSPGLKSDWEPQGDIKTSSTIGDIAAALARAQGKITDPKKDKVNPAYSTSERTAKFADLQSVIAETGMREWLSQEGICWLDSVSTASTREVKDGEGNVHVMPTLRVTVRFIHSSGQWIETSRQAEARNYSRDSVLGVETALRRYGAMGMMGMAAEDDDGASDSHGKPAARSAPAPSPGQQAQQILDGETIPVKDMLHRELLKRTEGDEVAASMLLESISSFMGKNRQTGKPEQVPGKKNVDQLTEAAAVVNLKILRKMSDDDVAQAMVPF